MTSHDWTGPIFVVGAQRSGTTWLGHAMSAAAASVGGLFTVNGKLLYHLLHWYDKGGEHQHFRSDEILYALERKRPSGRGVEEWLKRAEVVLNAVARRAAESTPPLSLDIPSICRSIYAAEPWGDKYNEYLLHLPELYAVFPTARWIFVVRHPMDVTQSMMTWTGVRHWNPASTLTCSSKWMSWNQEWLRFRTAVPVEFRTEVLYEEMGRATWRKASEWVGCDIRPFVQGFSPVTRRRDSTMAPGAVEMWEHLQRLCEDT